MISLLQEWRAWIGVALISGCFSLPIAFEKLSKECRYLVFFNPYISFAFWLWLIINLALPAVLVWVLYSFSTKPEINMGLFTQSITFGLVFTALVNAYVDTGFFGVDIKALYEFFIKRIYKLIAARQIGRAAAFWTDFTADLSQTNQPIAPGLDYLENYFEYDPSLTTDEKATYQRQLEQVRAQPSRPEQAKALKGLASLVRRKHLPKLLQRLGCSDRFRNQYFLKQKAPGS